MKEETGVKSYVTSSAISAVTSKISEVVGDILKVTTDVTSEVTGIISDIQHCSFHDGPGLRTTIFLKGCSLNCAWCHNPESISFEPEMLYYPDKCIGCGKCEEGCFAGAKVLCGKKMTVEMVINEILKDYPYYGDDGGVTVSGGEPLAQYSFTHALLQRCRKENIHCAVETSLCCSWDIAKNVLKACDLVMCDMKIWGDDLHKEYTSVSNKLIKENFIKLDSLNIPFIMRTPLVVGVNDNIKDILKIIEFASKFNNIIYYELLPYNPFGVTKAVALGKNEYRRFDTIDGSNIMYIAENVKDKAKQYGIDVKISGKSIA